MAWKTERSMKEHEGWVLKTQEAQDGQLILEVKNLVLPHARDSFAEFVSSILEQYNRKRTITDKQRDALQKAVERAKERAKERENQPAPEARDARLLEIETSMGWIKGYPIVHVDGGYVLTVATQKAKVPGSINVVRNGLWYGRLSHGHFQAGRDCPRDEIPALLETLRANAKLDQLARMSARITGTCIFCSLTLTDERSIKAGYGPICASNNGLPWGDN